MDGPRFLALMQWHQRLDQGLDLPFPAHYAADDEQVFVLVHHLYNPSELELDSVDQLLCDARQENRPMLVPLARVYADVEHPNEALLAEYRTWLLSLR